MPEERKNTDMNHHKTAAALPRMGFLLAAFCAARLAADVVETTNGARIVGRVTGIHGGVVTVATDYAGDINVKQALVASITTDHPIAVRTADGTRIIGMVSPAPEGGIRITSPTRSLDTPVGKVAASWAAGEEDPDVVARQRKWSYEAGVDISGTSGTHTQLGTAATFHAKLSGPDDAFQYYANYLRQESDSQVSADQFKAGVDYADNFSPLSSWYARDEGGFDRVNDETFFDVAATGYGYDFIKAKDETLTGRAGLSYRYDRYSTPNSASLSSAGADFELEYGKKFSKAELHDKLAFVPAFQDLGNFIVTHEASLDFPITKSLWKLSMGMTNNYDSRPVDDVGRLETIYFTRLVLSWGKGQTPP
jgi:putative salt-induced outer membrane protein YdiY